MILKRLDLIGFKSFADRTDIALVPGVTAVVGPNGSGKSNIVDALRWVLGEQSARTLRGGKMEDIIFSGSAGRKGVNFCEVNLVLDNSGGFLPVDFAEVTVSRRVYRSGDTEYLLNRNVCRLKDISELFLDTGIGREAFSIIGQGRIDEILSTRSEDRRAVFEEAASIVRFKSRRNEAEKKLADAEHSLTRIRDIAVGLESELGPLRLRAETAAEYRRLAVAARDLEVSVLVAEIDQLSARRVELQREVQEIESQVQTAVEREAVEQVALAGLRVEADRVDRELQTAQQVLLDATAAVEKREADRRVAFERLERVVASMDSLRQLQERLGAEEEEALRGEREASERASSLLARVESLNRSIEETRARDGAGELESLRKELSGRRSSLIEAMRRQAAKRNDLRHLEARRLEAGREVEKAAIGHSDAAAARLASEGALKAATSQRESLSRQAILAEREDAESRRRAEEAERALRKSAEERDARERTAIERKAQFTALSELQRELDGFAGGPKAILQAARDGKAHGVRGAVAGLLRVPKDLEAAIETALGPALQHIVVETERDARSAIEFLRRRQLGRATFLPLETIRARRIAPHDLQMVRSSSGFYGVAAELVESETDCLRVVEFLLGNVLLAVDLPSANAVARVLQHRYRVVTLGGDVVNAGGSMTGGSTGRRSSSLLGRPREIESLAAALKDAQEGFEAAQAVFLAAREGASQALSEAEEARAKRHDAEARVRAAELEEQAQRVELERALQRLQACEADASLAAADLGTLEEALGQAGRELAEIDEEVRLMEAGVAEIERALQRAEETRSGAADVLTELRVAVAEAQEAARGAEQTVQRIGQQKVQIQSERNRASAEWKAAEQQLALLREELGRHEEAGRSALAERERQGRELESLRERRRVQVQACEACEAGCERIREERRRLEERLRELEVSLGRVEVELETKLAALREEHRIGLELARQRHPLQVPAAPARQRLQSLRREMEAFGEVSLSAIEEYERLSARCEALRLEEADLLAARDHLLQLVKEIDAEMADRFRTVFAAIREQFSAVFRTLFDGGRADVLLTDEADPLRSGVEIVAEPPGKKMQSLTLLSGGERALTALALLFAILRVKPVPFCVLDEVEAALDEANVDRFARYLRSLSGQTQFLVVTHRRGTMEAADALYGVTMQESGVSRLVSVRVEEEDGAASA